MRPRIGCLPPLPPSVYLRQPLRQLPFPATHDGRMYASARDALLVAARAWAVVEGDEVLVPAYHHGAEVQALVKAGARCRFYGRTDPLVPDGAELDALLTRRTRALYLIHYFGFPQESLRWRTWCDERGLLLVEDATHAWAAWSGGLPVGWCADVAIFCAHRTAPVHEAAFVVSRSPVPPPLPNPSLCLSDLVRGHGAWLAQRSALVHAAAAAFVREPDHHHHAQDIALDIDIDDDAARAPWRGTEALLRRAVRPDLAALRRTNAMILLDRLGPVTPEPFRSSLPAASPFVLPVVSSGKARELEHLRSRGVQASELWARPHPALPERDFPEAMALRHSLVGLPVHQGLRLSDIDSVSGAALTRRPASPSCISVSDALDEVRDVWQVLQKRAPSPFSSYEWARAWAGHHGSAGRLVLVVCRDDTGRPRALLPLQRTIEPGGVRLLRFLGHGAADLLGPVCSDDDLVFAADVLRRLLDSGQHGDVLLADRFSAQLSWRHLLRGTQVRSESSPVLCLGDGGWEGFLSRSSRNFRQQVRRRERALERTFDVEFRLSTAASLEDDLDTLFLLHAARWREGTPFLSEQPFHRDFARAAMQQGWLRLWVLHVDGVAAAAWYGFRYAGQEWYYQAGRDPAYDQHRVGSVLLNHSVRAAAHDGASAYHFLRGDEEYKRHYTQYDLGTETVVCSRRSLRANAARHAMAVLAALPVGARELLPVATGASPSGAGRTSPSRPQRLPDDSPAGR